MGRVDETPVEDASIGSDASIEKVLAAYRNCGFQASHLAQAVDLLKTMRDEDCVIFLSVTANLIASGVRGCVVDLIRGGYVDAVVTTGGAIDHDIIRSQAPYLLGDFELDDVALHEKGVNRLGNILVPTQRYVLLEEVLQPLYTEYYATIGKSTTPSRLIDFLGSKIDTIDSQKDASSPNNASIEQSFLYHCHKKNIPVFCPGYTDAAVGLQLYFFTQEHKDFTLDVAGDLAPAIDLAMEAEKTGAFILGGGIAKHHTLGVNLLRGGLDYAVYVSTAQEYDGSLSGAHDREAKSWGKIAEQANTVTVTGEATIIVPLIVAGL